ncbi:MAG: restriction endonuclease, partial [Bacteroidales bacterium]|nr:restriction endonuclease [Bacteroidales bacterium]
MNPNIEYEKYIKTVFTQILKNEDIQNIFVDHDVKLKGKTGTHQIDVYWEYKQFGELIKVAVECKRYSKNVSIGVVRDFNSVLQDLNCSKGIIVTTTGFQKGAIEFASNNNISLKIIRKPVAEELKNTPKTL